MKQKTCTYCTKIFTKTGRNQNYCTTACYKAFQKHVYLPQYYQQHCESLIKSATDWIKANYTAHRSNANRWARTHRPQTNAKNHRRRARFLGKGNYTSQEWEEIKQLYNYTCVGCNRSESEVKLTVDHAIPIVKNGSNTKDNLQPLCKSCNSRKRDVIAFASCNIQTQKLMLAYSE